MKRLIVVLLVLLGIVAAVVVPDVYTALQRAKQKVTSASLNLWAVELEQYAAGHGGRYPELTPGPVARIRSLIPNPLLVTRDAWGRDIIYHGSGSHYLLHSLGRDGKNDFVPPGHATTNFDEDLVYADGTFLQYAEGT